MTEKTVLITEGGLPLWKRIAVSGILTFIIFLIIRHFLNHSFSFSEEYLIGLIKSLEIPIYLMGVAIYLSITNNYYFDFYKKKYKKELSFLFFKYGKWKRLPELEYVSAFKNSHDEFEVNLWYYKNRHFKIAIYYDFDDAINAAYKISNTMNIDLLDATTRGDFKFVDIDVYRDSGIIKHID